MNDIRLDPVEHRYFLEDGREVPGFSAICKDLGVTAENRFYSEFGRDRGTSVHLWARFLAEGSTPADEPDERIAGYVFAFKKFLSESRFHFEGGEHPVFHPGLFFACSPDLYGNMSGARCVIDIKTGAALPVHAAQTAAQKLALSANGIQCRDRYGLYLKDGDYRLEAHADKADEDRWKVIVAAYHAKRWYTKGGT